MYMFGILKGSVKQPRDKIRKHFVMSIDEADHQLSRFSLPPHCSSHGHGHVKKEKHGKSDKHHHRHHDKHSKHDKHDRIPKPTVNSAGHVKKEPVTPLKVVLLSVVFLSLAVFSPLL